MTSGESWIISVIPRFFCFLKKFIKLLLTSKTVSGIILDADRVEQTTRRNSMRTNVNILVSLSYETGEEVAEEVRNNLNCMVEEAVREVVKYRMENVRKCIELTNISVDSLEIKGIQMQDDGNSFVIQ